MSVPVLAPPASSPYPTTAYVPVPIVIAAPVSYPPSQFEESPLLTSYRKPAWAAVIFEILVSVVLLYFLSVFGSHDPHQLVDTWYGLVFLATILVSVSATALAFYGMRAMNAPCLVAGTVMWTVLSVGLTTWGIVVVVQLITAPCEGESCIGQGIAIILLVPVLITAICIAGPLLFVQCRYAMDVWKHNQIKSSVFVIEMQPTAGAPATFGAGAV